MPSFPALAQPAGSVWTGRLLVFQCCLTEKLQPVGGSVLEATFRLFRGSSAFFAVFLQNSGIVSEKFPLFTNCRFNYWRKYAILNDGDFFGRFDGRRLSVKGHKAPLFNVIAGRDAEAGLPGGRRR